MFPISFSSVFVQETGNTHMNQNILSLLTAAIILHRTFHFKFANLNQLNIHFYFTKSMQFLTFPLYENKTTRLEPVMILMKHPDIEYHIKLHFCSFNCHLYVMML